MKVDFVTFKLLMQSMNDGLREIKLLLSGTVDQNTLLSLARIAHKLRGEASVVGFSELTRQISKLEDIVVIFQGNGRLDTKQISTISVQIRKISDLCKNVFNRVLDQKRSRFSAKRTSSIDSSSGDAKSGISATLRILAMNVSENCGKNASVNLDHFNIDRIPKSFQAKIQDILIQLVRNAITHGIEHPAARHARSKPSRGVVTVRVDCNQKIACISVKDDGAGISLEDIRLRLINKYHLSVRSVAKLSQQALLSSLFLPGFSTLKKQQIHAGRGVGLDLVKSHIRSLNGKINIDYKVKEFTEFKIRIPIRDNKASGNLYSLQDKVRVKKGKYTPEICA